MVDTQDAENNYENENSPDKVAAILIMRLEDGEPYHRGMDVENLQFLVAKRKNGAYTFPGGKWGYELPKENVKEGGVRELAEETGVIVDPRVLKEVYSDEIETEEGELIRLSIFTLPYDLVINMEFQNLVASQTNWEYKTILDLLEEGDDTIRTILTRVLYVPSHIFVEDLFFHLGFHNYEKTRKTS